MGAGVAEQDTEKTEAGGVSTAQEAPAAPALGQAEQRPATAPGETAAADEAAAAGRGASGRAEDELLDEPPAEGDEADEPLAAEYAPEDDEGTLGEDAELVEERVVVVRRSAFYALAGLAAIAIIALAAGNLYQWRANSGSPAV